MTTKDEVRSTVEALKLAREALEDYVEEYGPHEQDSGVAYAITAIRAALASKSEALMSVPDGAQSRSDEEQPAPVAKPHEQQSASVSVERVEPIAYAVYHRMGGSKTLHWPEQHSEDGDHNEYRLVPLYEHPPAQQRNPVAVYVSETWCGSVVRLYEDLPLETPLYTSPPASKPWVSLTDDEVKHQWEIWRASIPRYVGFAKGIEAKLKEKNGF